MAFANPEATGLRLIETRASGVGTAAAAGVALAIGVTVAAGEVASVVAVAVAGGAIDTNPLPDGAGVAGLVPHAATTTIRSANAIAAKAAEMGLPRPSVLGIRRISLPSSDSDQGIVGPLVPAWVRQARPTQGAVSRSPGGQIGTTALGAGIICSVIEEPTNSFDGGPSACPFVAFEDDRDHRSDAPDYRHRCFAAPEPEPRAFPHQERYCLSDAFAGCPIFLDWARQEAAGVKAAAASAVIVASAAVDDIADADAGPAFLASRPRPTAAVDANAAGKRTGDASAGLWSYDAESKRTPAPAAPPPPSSLGAPAVAMARRGPTHPGWENPPRLETFPRLRSRDDRRANQPLLIVAVFITAIMVALVLYPFVFSSNHGPTAVGSGAQAPVGSGASQGSGASPSQGTGTSGLPRVSFQTYLVKSGDYMAKIAQRFNLTLYELQAANPLVPANGHIEIGQILNIPPAGYFTPPPASANPAGS